MIDSNEKFLSVYLEHVGWVKACGGVYEMLKK